MTPVTLFLATGATRIASAAGPHGAARVRFAAPDDARPPAGAPPLDLVAAGYKVASITFKARPRA